MQIKVTTVIDGTEGFEATLIKQGEQWRVIIETDSGGVAEDLTCPTLVWAMRWVTEALEP